MRSVIPQGDTKRYPPRGYEALSPKGIRSVIPQGDTKRYPPRGYEALSPKGIRSVIPQGDTKRYPPRGYEALSPKGIRSVIPQGDAKRYPRLGLRHESASRKIVAQMATARRMSQLTQCLGLDLTNSLTRDVEVLPDLFQRVILAIAQAKAHLQHLTLALGQHRQHSLDVLFEQLQRRRVDRLGGRLVFDEIAELARLFRPHRCLERDRLLGDAQDPAHLGRRPAPFAVERRVEFAFVAAGLQDRRGVFRLEHPYLERQFLGSGLAPQLLHQAPLGADQAVDRLDHVNGDADRAR